MSQIRFSKDGKLFFRTVSSGGVEVRDLPLTFYSGMRNSQEPLNHEMHTHLEPYTDSCMSHSYSHCHLAGCTMTLPCHRAITNEKCLHCWQASEVPLFLPHQVYSFPELEKLHVLMGHTAATYSLDLSPSEGCACLNLSVTQPLPHPASLIDLCLTVPGLRISIALFTRLLDRHPTLSTLLG